VTRKAPPPQAPAHAPYPTPAPRVPAPTPQTPPRPPPQLPSERVRAKYLREKGAPALTAAPASVAAREAAARLAAQRLGATAASDDVDLAKAVEEEEEDRRAHPGKAGSAGLARRAGARKA
jgi:hypothetical protein